MTITAIRRSASDGNPVARTIAVRKRVKNVKLRINPVTIPQGLRFPLMTDPPSTIGRTGRMQGDKIVTIPARNANRRRMSMYE